MIDLTNPVILIPTLAILLICVAISKKIKNPYIMLGILAINIGVLLSHFLRINSAKEGGAKVIEDGISWFWDKI